MATYLMIWLRAPRAMQWQSIDFGLPDRRRRPGPYTVTARLIRPPGLLTVRIMESLGAVGLESK